jgi:hypothetical protein
MLGVGAWPTPCNHKKQDLLAKLEDICVVIL